MKYFVSLLLVLLVSISAYGQKKKLKKADKAFLELRYSLAIDNYEAYINAVDSMKVTNTTRLRLAECYKRTNQTEKAEPLIARIVKNSRGQVSNYFIYAELLMSNGKYEEAKEWFLKYSELRPADPRGKELALICENVKLIRPVFPNLSIYPISVNSTTADDFGPAFMGDEICFSSDRAGLSKNIADWTGRAYLNMYVAEIKEDGDLDNVRPIDKKINSATRNEGPASFTNDGKVMYFSRNSYSSDVSDVTKLDILRVEMKNGYWSKARILPFCSKEFSESHPSISQDGKTLYFTSDRPGGYGGKDIWVSYYRYGEWSKPENLGPEINTRGDEAYPFTHSSGKLYFASKGLPGFGGYDVFMAKNKGTHWADIRNLGKPINSEKDDIGFILSEDENSGYVVSNRQIRDERNDDIYRFDVFTILLKGVVYDANSREPLPDVQITLSPENEKPIHFPGNSKGGFRESLEAKSFYTLLVEKEGYSSHTEKISTRGLRKAKVFEKAIYLKAIEIPEPQVVVVEKPKPVPNVLSVIANTIDKTSKAVIPSVKVTLVNKTLGKIEQKFSSTNGVATFKMKPETNYELRAEKQGYFSASLPLSTIGVKKSESVDVILPLDKIVLNKAIRLDNIYYDLAKADIREDAAKELDKLVKLLKDNPTIEIELSSHTDARGGADYNQRLSQSRAKAAVAYIITNGIEQGRITGIGYGEAKILNECLEGVRCSEELHQENRRTEFKVTKF